MADQPNNPSGAVPKKRASGFRELFKPNGAASSTSLRILAAGYIGWLIFIWFNSSKAIPRPWDMWTALGPLWFEEGLGRELLTSLKLILQALGLSSLISLSIAYMARIPAGRPIGFLACLGRFQGIVGLSFAFTLWFHGGHKLKLALLVFGLSVFMVDAMIDRVRSVSEETLDHSRTCGMSEWRVIWEDIILGTLHDMILIIRNMVAMGWVMLPMAEGLSRGEGGVGGMLLNQNRHMDMAAIFVINTLIFTTGFCIDRAIGAVDQLACPYAFLGGERKKTPWLVRFRMS